MQMAIDVAGFTRGRGRPAAPGHGLEAQRRAHGAAARPASTTAWPSDGITGDDRRRDLRQARRLRQLRLPREPLGVASPTSCTPSSWLKLHYPAAFCAALLNAQPMGFYSPHTLVRRRPPPRRRGARPRRQRQRGRGHARAVRRSAGGVAVRLGIEYVRTIGDDLAERIAAGRPYASMEDVVPARRADRWPQVEALATAGAFGCFGARPPRRRCGRRARWPRPRPDRLRRRRHRRATRRTLPGMSEVEETAADLWATGVVARRPPHRVRPRRSSTRSASCPPPACATSSRRHRVLVGGVVTHRQRPATARAPRSSTSRTRPAWSTSSARRACGPATAGWPAPRPRCSSAAALEKVEGVINVVAERIEPLTLSTTALKSRDFR